ncbi:MAG: hypothetical protein IT305_07195 [Chloroflexi bacterium]|nr:hypothetical protein [Chloroflexota bacterium]
MNGSKGGEIRAPDGIIIRPIPGADSPLVSVVVGVIPPRSEDYPVHLHYALEQVTVGMRGTVTAIQRRPGDAQPTEVVLAPGGAIATPPSTTLAFRNNSAEDAEVLFICVPAYPSTNADTEVLHGGHRPLTELELRRSAERLRRAQDYLSTQLEAKLAALRWLAQVDDAEERHRP